MRHESNNENGAKAKRYFGFILAILLYLMYSSTFLNDYLMNDEWAAIGVKTPNILISARDYFFSFGRGLGGLLQPLVFNFVGYNPWRIQFIHFLSFVLVLIIAIFLYRFIEARSGNTRWAFFLILLLFSQAGIQGIMGYSLLLFAKIFPSIFLSLLAFYLFFYGFGQERFPSAVQIGLVFLILLFASQAAQTTMFFSVIPLSYLILTAWDKYRKKILAFLAICFSALLFASAIYRFGLEYWHSIGNQGYSLGEQVVVAATKNPLMLLKAFINPYTYWSAFKIWSYPYPFNSIPPINENTKAILAMIVFLIWAVLVVLALTLELQHQSRHEKSKIVYKWLSVLACLGLGALIVVMDSPLEVIDHRAYINLTFTGVVIFTGGYSFQAVRQRYHFLGNKAVIYLCALFVLLMAFGAQSNVLRGIVVPRMENVNFIRTELAAKDPTEYSQIIVVLPRWYGCITEPCEPWMGKVTGIDYHLSRMGAYRYALSTLGIPPESKSIVFLTEAPDVTPPGSIIVNWEKYLIARKPSMRNP